MPPPPTQYTVQPDLEVGDPVDDATHIHRVSTSLTLYSPGSVNLSNTGFKKEQSIGGKKDVVQSVDGTRCYRCRCDRNMNEKNELFGVSMFTPTEAGVLAFQYAHRRMAEVTGQLSCYVTTAGAMRTAGFGVEYDRCLPGKVPPVAGEAVCRHICVSPAEGGSTVSMIAQPTAAGALAEAFHVCQLLAAAEPVDLPDSKDLGGDTAALLLESVLEREDLPPAVRFEAAVWQFVVTELTETDVLATIAVDEHLAELLSFHDFGEEKRDVVTDDVIRKIECAVQTTLQVSSSTVGG